MYVFAKRSNVTTSMAGALAAVRAASASRCSRARRSAARSNVPLRIASRIVFAAASASVLLSK